MLIQKIDILTNNKRNIFGFYIITKNRTSYIFKCDNEQQRDKWINGIKKHLKSIDNVVHEIDNMIIY